MTPSNVVCPVTVKAPARVAARVELASVRAVPPVPNAKMRFWPAAEVIVLTPKLVKPAGVTLLDTTPDPLVCKTPLLVVRAERVRVPARTLLPLTVRVWEMVSELGTEKLIATGLCA